MFKWREDSNWGQPRLEGLIREVLWLQAHHQNWIMMIWYFPPVNLAPKEELTIILSVHPDHRHHLKEDFGLGVDESAAAAFPASSLQVEAVDIDSLCRRLGDVVLHPSGHLVTQHHAVQGPALVGPSDLLQVQRTNQQGCSSDVGSDVSHLSVLSLQKRNWFCSQGCNKGTIKIKDCERKRCALHWERHFWDGGPAQGK